jgi:hypothetical protein
LLGGCKSNEAPTDQGANDSAAQQTDTTQPALLRANREEIAAFAEEWNSNINIGRINELGKYYADTVSYFGKDLKREEVVEVKKSYVASNPDIESIALINVVVMPMPDAVMVDFGRSITKKQGVETQTGYILHRRKRSTHGRPPNAGSRVADEVE